MKTTTSRPPASSSTDQEKSASNRPVSSTDSRITELDQKWLDWFNWLEALLIARTLDRPQDQTFTAVKVTPTHAPANVIRPEPFLKPASQNSQLPDRPSSADPPTTDPVSKHRSTIKLTASQSSEPTSKPTSQRQPASAFDSSRKDSSSASDTDSDSFSSDRPPLDLFPEDG